MGMLLTYREGYRDEPAKAEKPKRSRNRAKVERVAPEVPTEDTEAGTNPDE